MVRHGEVCEPSSQRVVSIPFTGNGLEVVEKCSDLAFADIKMNAGPLAGLVSYVKKDDHVLPRVGNEISVIRVLIILARCKPHEEMS